MGVSGGAWGDACWEYISMSAAWVDAICIVHMAAASA